MFLLSMVFSHPLKHIFFCLTPMPSLLVPFTLWQPHSHMHTHTNVLSFYVSFSLIHSPLNSLQLSLTQLSGCRSSLFLSLTHTQTHSHTHTHTHHTHTLIRSPTLHPPHTRTRLLVFPLHFGSMWICLTLLSLKKDLGKQNKNSRHCLNLIQSKASAAGGL